METRILNDLVLSKGLVMADNLTEFPLNPQIGTFVIKDQCLYGYIKIGGMETWYPFASKTNSYVHVQGLASTVWTVNHNLGTTDVWTQIKDANGYIVSALVETIDLNTVQVTFTTAITGTAVVVAPDSIDVPQVKATSLEVSNGDVIIDSSGIRINGSYVLTDANITQIAEQAAVDQIAASTTDDIDEGATNQYFTVSRARNSISAGTGVSYDTATGQVSIGQSVATTAAPQFAGLSLSGHVIPTTDVTYDLGSSTKRFRDLYLSGSTIYVGDGVISFDSTSNSFQFKDSAETEVKVSLAANTTDELAEGATNKYFTIARAAAAAPVQSVNGMTGTVTIDDSYPVIANDTTTNASLYPVLAAATSGDMAEVKVSNTKLTFNPSTGDLSASNFNSLSDINYKENITKVVNAIGKVSQLNGYEYDWKDGSGSSYGVIAQEVKEILPKAVTVDAAGKHTVNYSAIIPFLIEAIKEQELRIAKLEDKQ